MRSAARRRTPIIPTMRSRWNWPADFWASLPYLDRDLIAAILARAHAGRARRDAPDFSAAIDTEAFRAALGRIACGYDGGQIIDE